jgi:hypothetical protein
MKQTTYHPEWQNNRINFILSKYPKEFFKGKRILEVGAYNGYIGAYFNSLGAEVHCLEGRLQNVNNIKNDYPFLNTELADLDTPDWKWGHYDIIINFGLYYHLEKYHKEHLENCINNCDLMFFESVIYDSFEDEIYFRQEEGWDQSLSTIGGNPSTSYVENIFKQYPIKYEKFCDSSLNGAPHKYDWIDSNSKILDGYYRRFWIINK